MAQSKVPEVNLCGDGPTSLAHGLQKNARLPHLNSVLQTLYCIPDFLSAIINYRTSETSNVNLLPSKLQHLFVQLQARRGDGTEILECLDLGAEPLVEVERLWHKILSVLQCDLQNSEIKGLVGDLFMGEIQNYTSCTECGLDESRPMKCLSVPLNVYPSLEESLRAHFQLQRVDACNPCSRCNKLSDFLLGDRFSQLPRILTLQLMRFDVDSKTNQLIIHPGRMSFPQKLDIQQIAHLGRQEGELSNGQGDAIPQSSARNSKNTFVYELFSIFLHSGESISDNYYVYVKNPTSSQWTCYDDTRVDPVPEDAVQDTCAGTNSRGTAYMLMYSKIDTDQGRCFLQPPVLPPRRLALDLEYPEREIDSNMANENVADPNEGKSPTALQETVIIDRQSLALQRCQDRKVESLETEGSSGPPQESDDDQHLYESIVDGAHGVDERQRELEQMQERELTELSYKQEEGRTMRRMDHELAGRLQQEEDVKQATEAQFDVPLEPAGEHTGGRGRRNREQSLDSDAELARTLQNDELRQAAEAAGEKEPWYMMEPTSELHGREDHQRMSPSERRDIISKETDPKQSTRSSQHHEQGRRYQFQPVDGTWQRQIAGKLQAPIAEFNIPSVTPKPLGRPSAILDVEPDGNSFFRCISTLVTGDERNHYVIRGHVVSRMETIGSLLLTHLPIGIDTVEQYIRDERVRAPGSRVTDVEMYAASDLLQTDICVFRERSKGFVWTTYSTTDLGRPASNARPVVHELAIYVEHTTEDHYNIVSNVQ